MCFSTLVCLYLLDSQLANDSIANYIKDLGLPNVNPPESDEDDNPDEADEADESINTLRTSKSVFSWPLRVKGLRIRKIISPHWFKLIQGFFASTLYQWPFAERDTNCGNEY